MTHALPPIDNRPGRASIREQADDRLRVMARRPMASRRTRRILVALYALVGLTGMVLPWLLTPLWTEGAAIAGIIVLLVIYIGLNQSVRNVTHLRDEVLDDLLVRLVDRFHRRAYQYLAAVTLPIGLLIYLPDVDRRWLTTCAWLLITLSVGLPSTFAALSFPDEDDAPVIASPRPD
jgi:hypothetical protein